MNVDTQLQEKWEVLRSKGDSAKIVAFAAKRNYEVTVRGVNQALRDGNMSDELFEVIADFYQQKADMVAAYL